MGGLLKQKCDLQCAWYKTEILSTTGDCCGCLKRFPRTSSRVVQWPHFPERRLQGSHCSGAGWMDRSCSTDFAMNQHTTDNFVLDRIKTHE